MSAIKNGIRIGVFTKDKKIAELYMMKNFNFPDKITISSSKIKYEYNDGDVVEWVNCTDNSIGRRYDKLFILPDIERKIVDEIIRPQSVNPIRYVYHDCVLERIKNED